MGENASIVSGGIVSSPARGGHLRLVEQCEDKKFLLNGNNTKFEYSVLFTSFLYFFIPAITVKPEKIVGVFVQNWSENHKRREQKYNEETHVRQSSWFGKSSHGLF